MAKFSCTTYFRIEPDYDEEKYDQAWNRERDLRGQLTRAVEKLISNPPPRNSRWLPRRGRALVERRRKRLRAKQDAKSDEDNNGDAPEAIEHSGPRRIDSVRPCDITQAGPQGVAELPT